MEKRINYKNRNRITPVLESKEIYIKTQSKNYFLSQGEVWANLARDIVKKGQNINRKFNSISLKKKKPRMNKKLLKLRKQIASELQNINNSSSQTANLIILRDKIDVQMKTNRFNMKEFEQYIINTTNKILYPAKPMPNL